jgi:ribose transport system substrate-binding protein
VSHASIEGLRPAPCFGRRSFLGLLGGALILPRAVKSEETRRYRIGFANLTEDPGARLEGFGFTGADIRASFALAARERPIDMVFYDNDRNRAKAIANAEDAAAQKLDLYVQYCDDAGANAEIAKRLKSAGIPVLAVIYPVPEAPLYGPDDAAAGGIAGAALAQFAAGTWRGRAMAAAIVGDLGNAGDRVPERADAIAAALKAKLPDVAQSRFDSNGNPAQADAQLRRFAAAQPQSKLLIAALDDVTALMAKAAVEATGRVVDTAIVSLGCDRAVHGGSNDKKEIDPGNRASILIGSVGYFLDRYGYDVLPLAMRLLRGETVPPRSTTQHVLVSGANVFTLYPPIDMN